MNPKTDPQKLASDLDRYQSLKSSTGLTPSLLDNNSNLLWQIAQHEQAPKDVLFELVRLEEKAGKTSDIPNIGYLVAQNPGADPGILQHLSEHRGPQTRLEVAANPNTELGTLSILAKDKNPTVRYWVSKHPRMPFDASLAIIQELAKDETPEIRQYAAEHPNTPIAILAVLAQDSNETVRNTALEHPNVPPKHLL